jgi:hypothetical protein
LPKTKHLKLRIPKCLTDYALCQDLSIIFTLQ